MALSFDPRSQYLTDADFAIMTNRELIALNQDRMGQQADLITDKNNWVVFAKDCENGDIALSVTNMSSKIRKYTFDFSQIPALSMDSTYTVRDLWEGKEIAPAKGAFTVPVKKHATQVFRLSPKRTLDGVKSPLSAKGFSIRPSKGCVSVEMPATASMAKRILVSDMSGRVIKTLNTTSEQATLPLEEGAYVVNVSCGAQVASSKVLVGA